MILVLSYIRKMFLSNWYRQILDIHYTATNISKDEYVGIVRYKANKEERIEEKNRNRK